MNGMGTTDAYTIFAMALSLVALALASVYAYQAVHAYRVFHDDRAAVALAKAIGMVVIAVGMNVSAFALFVNEPTLAIAGLSLARGAFVVLLGTLVLAGVRSGAVDE